MLKYTSWFAGLALVLLAPASSGALPTVDSCVEAAYLNRTATAADRQFNWDYSFAGDPERCIKIYVGQSVQWNGNFAGHPLDPDQGDTPNPIASHAAGLVTFTQPGVFGYRCNFHFEMRGAVWVVPAPPVQVTPLFNGPLGWGLLACSLMALGLLAQRRFRGNTLMDAV